MCIDPSKPEEIDRFIVEEIDSVPQLEALLLFWRNRPRNWSSSELAKALYVSPEVTQSILRTLLEHRLIQEIEDQTDCYALRIESSEKERLLDSLERTYRKELVRVSNMIHTKASRAVRDFASAFRFRKD